MIYRMQLLATGARVSLAELQLKLANLMPVEYTRFLNEHAAKQAASNAAEPIAPEDYRLPTVFQRIIDTGAWPKERYAGRHDLLVKAARCLAHDALPIEYIESVLCNLSCALGLERDDASGILKWVEREFYN